LEQVYDISELGNIWAGAIPMTVDEENIGSKENREGTVEVMIVKLMLMHH
jgi:hypothetical protein